ncbi:MAG: BatD family protein [Gammaproteobacteria bacterium]|nr:BatD family protein [Gammaproteobacteria bacterium]
MQAVRIFSRAIISLVILSFSLSVFAVSARVDQKSVNLGDSLTLVVTVKANRFPSNYDLAPLRKDFLLIGRRIIKHDVAYTNDNKRLSILVADLVPKHAGVITIPSLNIGKQKTLPQTITVKKVAVELTKDGKPLDNLLTARVDLNSPYLEQQVIYTVKLFSLRHVSDGVLGDPTVAGSIVSRLGHDRNYDLTIAGRKYRIYERRYAIFPMRVGHISIIPPVFRGEVGRFSERKDVRLVASILNLNVQPIPQTFDKKWWVPAKQLVLLESWLPKNPQFKVGKTVTRILILRGVGLTALQLPEIYQGDLVNVHTYALQPDSGSVALGADVIGSWQQKIELMPTRSGKLVLPVITVKWWNTLNNKPDQSTIAARTINVAPLAGNLPATTTSLKDLSVSIKNINKAPGDVLLAISDYWLWGVLLLFIVLLLASLIWAVTKRKEMVSAQEAIIVHERKRSLRLARQLIEEAAVANDPHQTRNGLLKWAELRWDGRLFLGLPNVADAVNDHDLQEAIGELQRVLYSEAQLKWNGVEFWNTFNESGE